MPRSGNSSFFLRFRAFLFGFAMLAVLSTTGCASFYVDTALKDVPTAQLKKPAELRPVQLLFEFQTKSATNSRVTEMLKTKVTDVVKSSGLFSAVGSDPAPDGAVLNVVVNNVPMTDNAFGKGFVTGLTFGIAGSAVTDGYICNIDYLPGGNAPKISKTVRHAIHATMGAANAPANAVKSASIEEAVDTMIRQIVSNGLKEASNDPSFK